MPARGLITTGPPRKGEGRTPGMHGHGKSDRPVVPAKLPNKAGRGNAQTHPVAEAVEGRGRGEGRLTRGDTPRTQRRPGVPYLPRVGRAQQVLGLRWRRSRRLPAQACWTLDPSQEPRAVVPHAGICAGGWPYPDVVSGQGQSLPRRRSPRALRRCCGHAVCNCWTDVDLDSGPIPPPVARSLTPSPGSIKVERGAELPTLTSGTSPFRSQSSSPWLLVMGGAPFGMVAALRLPWLGSGVVCWPDQRRS